MMVCKHCGVAHDAIECCPIPLWATRIVDLELELATERQAHAATRAALEQATALLERYKPNTIPCHQNDNGEWVPDDEHPIDTFLRQHGQPQASTESGMVACEYLSTCQRVTDCGAKIPHHPGHCEPCPFVRGATCIPVNPRPQASAQTEAVRRVVEAARKIDHAAFVQSEELPKDGWIPIPSEWLFKLDEALSALDGGEAGEETR